MDVILYKVGRNLNRAYRACASFGVERLLLVDCPGEVRGNLYSAAGWVEIERLRSLSEVGMEDVMAFETWGDVLLSEICWEGICGVVIGGESSGLPRSFERPLTGRIDGASVLSLTVEAALAVVLYAWRLDVTR